MNNEEYPPFFQLDIVGYVGLGFAVQVERDVQITPEKQRQKVKNRGSVSACDSVTYFSE